jgi:beta-glucanase (GH16 family)
LVGATLLMGIIFFSLLSGTCHIKSKTEYTRLITSTKESNDSAQLINATEMDQETIIDEDTLSDVYKNTDPKVFKLLWQEDFEGDKINIERWSCVRRINNDNNELQSYIPENVKVANGILYLIADESKNNDKRFSSGMIESLNKDEFLYGKIEIYASIPKGKGLFPAIWMLCETGNNYEIDILEAIGSDSSLIYGVNHFYYGGKKLRTYYLTKIKNPQEFHTYSIEWTPDKIVWYVDNNIFHQTNSGVPDENMYLILNLAVGGNWPGEPDSNTVFPSSFKIDYIRIYEYIGNK